MLISAIDFGKSVDWQKVRARSEAELDETVRAVVPEGVEVRTRLLEGNPSKVLIEAAEGADLLVVGARGRGGFGSLLLGSVSSQCVQHSPCPVVVIPSSWEPARG